VGEHPVGLRSRVLKFFYSAAGFRGMSDPRNQDLVASRMAALRRGSREAVDQLVEWFYPELRKLAASKMCGERGNHTLQPTALVNELYLELCRVKRLEERGYEDEQERAAFFALAGQVMRRLLIHHARPLARRSSHVSEKQMPEATVPGVDALQQVEDALARLEAISPRLRQVVEMKVFESLTGEEIAERLGCSERTVVSDWNVAKRWLAQGWLGTIET
jgi:RNA polymerase sigma factor (TIGR02999 family)